MPRYTPVGMPGDAGVPAPPVWATGHPAPRVSGARRVFRGIGRAVPVIRRVRSVARLVVVVGVTGGGFALAMVSVTGTGAIAIPVPQSSAMAHATQVIADLILPIPDPPKTTSPAPPAGPVMGQPVLEQPVNGSLATRQHGTAGEVEDAFARQTATGRCVVTEVPAGSASVRLSAGQLGELTAREKVDPAFAARIGERRQMLCGEASKGSRPESAVRVG